MGEGKGHYLYSIYKLTWIASHNPSAEKFGIQLGVTK